MRMSFKIKSGNESLVSEDNDSPANRGRMLKEAIEGAIWLVHYGDKS
jgi:hypothetical protein